MKIGGCTLDAFNRRVGLRQGALFNTALKPLVNAIEVDQGQTVVNKIAQIPLLMQTLLVDLCFLLKSLS